MQARELEHAVGFGDRDPAGIVFSPNVFSWFDRTLHDWLRSLGGHASLCKELGAIRLGLMDASAQFRRAMRDGDTLLRTLSIEEWGRKSLRLASEGRLDGQIAVVGTEVRGLFKLGDNGMFAGDIEPLRKVVGSDGRG